MKKIKTLTVNGQTYAITDPDAARIDDSSADSAWSGRNILNKFCQPFEKQGTMLTYGNTVPGVALPVELTLPSGCSADRVRLWHGGKNLLGREETYCPTVPGKTKTKSGVTFVCRSDGGFDISGTPTANFVLQIGAITLPAGTYTISFGGKHLNAYARLFRYVNGESLGEITDTSLCVGGSLMSQSFTLEQPETLYAKIYLVKGRACSATVFPMIQEGSAYTGYAPYVGEYIPVDIVSGAEESYRVQLQPCQDRDTVYAESGSLTLTGWTDPQITIARLQDRIGALEEALLSSI